MRFWRPPRRLDQGEEASLVEHLEELRQRLFTCLGAVVVATIVAFVFHRHLIHWLEQPLPKKHRQLVTFSPGEPFMTSVWVSIWAGALFVMPVILWQIWAFFIPAFDKSHERMLKAFVFLSSTLLVAGVVFGYFVALPAAVTFLTNYDNNVYTVLIRARDYISFATKVLLAMALVFELPVFVVGLTRLGILTTDKLRHNRRIGYFVVACIAVALPGVDPVTTIFEGIPLAILYEISIWLSVFLDRRSAQAKAAAVAGT
jgi:sec-independent protein translocase protein TatC